MSVRLRALVVDSLVYGGGALAIILALWIIVLAVSS
jgi:hypothetical protein